jgi:hypothetical protein
MTQMTQMTQINAENPFSIGPGANCGTAFDAVDKKSVKSGESA